MEGKTAKGPHAHQAAGALAEGKSAADLLLREALLSSDGMVCIEMSMAGGADGVRFFSPTPLND